MTSGRSKKGKWRSGSIALGLAAAIVAASAPCFARPRTGPVCSELRDRVYQYNGHAVALAGRIAADNGGQGTRATAKAIIEFVQGLRYIEEPNNGIDDWQYPDETLARGGGDCEDKAILAYVMLRSVGLKARIVDMPRHMAVAVNLGGWSHDCDDATYWDTADGRFHYVECTNAFPIGHGYPGGRASLHSD